MHPAAIVAGFILAALLGSLTTLAIGRYRRRKSARSAPMSLTIDQRLEQMTAAQHAAAADAFRLLRDLTRRLEHVPARCMDILDAQEELRASVDALAKRIDGLAAVPACGRASKAAPVEPPWPSRAESTRMPESEAERFQRWLKEVRPAILAARDAADAARKGTPDDMNDAERRTAGHR